MKRLDLNQFKSLFKSDRAYEEFIASLKEALRRSPNIAVTDVIGNKIICYLQKFADGS